VPQRGYGQRVAAGIQNSRGKFVIMAIPTTAYDFSALDAFVVK